MCTLLHRAVSKVFHHPAPEDGLTFVVGSLQFEPGIIGIDCAAGEKVANLFCAYHNIHTHAIATPHDWVYAIQWRSNWLHFALPGWRDFRFRFFSHGERRGELILLQHSRL